MNEIIISFYARRMHTPNERSRSSGTSIEREDYTSYIRIYTYVYINKVSLSNRAVNNKTASTKTVYTKDQDLKRAPKESKVARWITHTRRSFLATHSIVNAAIDHFSSFLLWPDRMNSYSPCVAWNDSSPPVRRRETGKLSTCWTCLPPSRMTTTSKTLRLSHNASTTLLREHLRTDAQSRGNRPRVTSSALSRKLRNYVASCRMVIVADYSVDKYQRSILQSSCQLNWIFGRCSAVYMRSYLNTKVCSVNLVGVYINIK